jgi:hypothetical protein
VAAAANAGNATVANAALARVTKAVANRRGLVGIPANAGLGAIVATASANAARAVQVAKNKKAANAAAAKAVANAELAAAAKKTAEAKVAAAAKAVANAKTMANANAARAAHEAAEKAARNAAAAKAEANRRLAAATRIQAAFRGQKARLNVKKALAKAAAKAKAVANARGAFRRVGAAVRLGQTLTGTGRAGRLAALAAQTITAPKKNLETFLRNFRVSGGGPTRILKNVTKETAVKDASKFLNTPLLVPIAGHKYPNKLNWGGAVEALDQYDLSNAQKNMIRRLNIAVAAQPTKGRFEKRRLVKINISRKTRNQAIAAHKAVMKKENEERLQQEQAMENQERLSKRATKPVTAAPRAPEFKPTGSRATYGMF